MNMTQALTKLRKHLGKKAALRDNKRPSSPEQRERSLAVFREAKAAHEAASKAAQDRREAILAADGEYQTLKAMSQVAHDRLREVGGWQHYFRYTGGTIGGVAGLSFFHVEAEADTLAELVEKVAAKKEKR